jgi:hypothetical protein
MADYVLEAKQQFLFKMSKTYPSTIQRIQILQRLSHFLQQWVRNTRINNRSRRLQRVFNTFQTQPRCCLRCWV